MAVFGKKCFLGPESTFSPLQSHQWPLGQNRSKSVQRRPIKDFYAFKIYEPDREKRQSVSLVSAEFTEGWPEFKHTKTETDGMCIAH